MTNKPFHITGLGSALIDIYAHVTNAELAELADLLAMDGGNSTKGTMLLIEEAQSRLLLERLKPDSQAAGGATANSIFGMAHMGLKTGFIGKIGNDAFGQLFAADMAAQNIAFPTNIKQTGATPPTGHVPTGHVIVLITPDAERTMYTLIGASATLAPQDLDKDLLSSSAYFFSEAYLFDSQSAKQAFITACDWVHTAGGQIVFSLADPLCVVRHRAELIEIIEQKIDILLANEAEACALFGGARFADTVTALQAKGKKTIITRSEKGAVIIWQNEIIGIHAEPVSNIIDLTGAGDQFAAGFLSGLILGKELAICGRRGALAASETISHIGPRPQADINKLFARAGL